MIHDVENVRELWGLFSDVIVRLHNMGMGKQASMLATFYKAMDKWLQHNPNERYVRPTVYMLLHVIVQWYLKRPLVIDVHNDENRVHVYRMLSYLDEALSMDTYYAQSAKVLVEQLGSDFIEPEQANHKAVREAMRLALANPPSLRHAAPWILAKDPLLASRVHDLMTFHDAFVHAVDDRILTTPNPNKAK